MDAILYWNDVALEANRVSHTNGKGEQTGPPLSARALAIVHLAMYDAFAGVTNTPATLPLYLSGLPPVPAGASADAAIAAAAHATLTKLFPSQKPFFDMKHLQAGLMGTGLNTGHAFGLFVAHTILDDRKNDPDARDDGYAASVARGAHRPDPDNPDQGFHAPFYGARSKGIAIKKRLELDAPPHPGDPEYLTALKEVRVKGIAPELIGTLPPGSPLRTPLETLIGMFWSYDGTPGLGTPPRLYNQIIRLIAMAKGNSLADNARLFAFVNAAMADAGILAWDQKYIHDLWRPILGVREHDLSMGPTGTPNNIISPDSDPSWLPLGALSSNAPIANTPNTYVIAKNFTPPFPAYPSGHATFGGAAFQITRLFYKVLGHGPDHLFDNLAMVSDELNGFNKDNKGTVRPRHVRNFPKGLAEMIEENGRSRVFLGVHWIFDAFVLDASGSPDFTRNIGGVKLGVDIAEDIFAFGGGKAPKKSTVPPRY